MLRFIPSSAKARALRRSAVTAYRLNRLTCLSSLQQNRTFATQPTDDFLTGGAADYVDEMYDAWKKDPNSVHASWQAYFKNVQERGVSPSKAFQAPPLLDYADSYTALDSSLINGNNYADIDVGIYMKVQLLVRAYQSRGHHLAKLDPLGINVNHNRPSELTLEHYGFTESDLNRTIHLGPGILPNFREAGRKTMTLREIVETCEKIYCGSFAVEFTHISSRKRSNWILSHLETPTPFRYSHDQKIMIFDRLSWADSFERFLFTKFPNDKRFGLEGCEAMVPGMKALIDRSVDEGISNIVIGMAHRGRLNLLHNIVRKPAQAIFSEFRGTQDPDDEGSGDVKYHLGMNYQRPTPSGKRVSLSLVANPSHLEAEDPVVLGKVRAIQHYTSDEASHEQSMGILIHGDAAFAAQGVVYETFGLHALPGYSTGGTVHIVINNQIGFTTDPRFARSTPYCTDIAKSMEAPIFHVNGDDVEAVTFICQLAADWRKAFKTDVVVDIVCYRRHGHNETDQPSFTQPRMYKAIAKHPPTFKIYTQQLLQEKTVSKAEVDAQEKRVWDILESSFESSKNYKSDHREWLSNPWVGFASPKDLMTKILPSYPTGVNIDTLKQIGKALYTLPEGFDAHRNLKRILNNRNKSISSGEGIDMPTAEALAFGTLLEEGHHVRVSGQDVERGTFSQRHAVLHDQSSENVYIPLNHLSPNQASFVIRNSSLSEYGVLGFEYGYSLSSPNALVVWEAQFGDFANNAQCIIDQFIAAGETKWLQRTGIVLSLPHGYDGQGPEHSSARMERYLQLCNEDPREFPSEEKLQRQHQDCNIQAIYVTKPSQYFHALRRNIHRQFRKPLVIFFSKSLLRHPAARSTIDEFDEKHGFKLILEEEEHGKSILPPEKIEKLIICSGQVWVALSKAREENKIDNIAITRVEQLHPFGWKQMAANISQYPNLKEIIWCQEEPLNAGAWTYMEPRIYTILKHLGRDLPVRYAGRPPSASVAAGNKQQHLAEQEQFLNDALL
ncbi:2-oxoglutarate dehydrogenase, mitochondrial [Schizosaccharomyces pombe]|uniref:2-oxoglutarate dehydrogenase, mitochondrial n=1 Tax=Schizosaccharomyces pombe (strain 972 / ATCC 24843) TaxID=284812 RepID=ODO1_SCHPO|nr:alpha-ketoglutarate dehydrogenase [Schizosaccharomyces pombe]O74378.1 RecName: Full=2-oxoglutarate dehydrogenase, mitochondrial; AltName: Full=2-oxoglutarate dehydrogenase complex component E1; Short=OGDC-E1; AltName: Full=Alpha-ketoglutarate dehydrogenase; Flags: Precursor [Schizosaccharomyces pombe 972h-]CAA20299.1 2-oxoglutarate dehydrogenase (lipoamide) (e1 component of oxoglutarate dehydrogenase complex) (predicted) [Schizosaccharomyces pombe]|eukprot:NP_595772.1 alpha-ketoglutarate dehydrogenase [Schizosaccharomyces pombe]